MEISVKELRQLSRLVVANANQTSNANPQGINQYTKGTPQGTAHGLAEHLLSGKLHDPQSFRSDYSEHSDAEKVAVAKELNRRGLLHTVDARKRTPMTSSDIVSSARGQLGKALAQHDTDTHNGKLDRATKFEDTPTYKKMLGQPTTNEGNPNHDELGRFAGGSGGGKGKGYKGEGTKEDPARCGANIELAATLLAAGKHVRLKQPEQVATLLGKMKQMIDDAMTQGEAAPKFDLCKVSAKGTNLFCQESLGIPRINMPQMRGVPIPGTHAATLPVGKKSGKVDLSAEFIDHLKSKGIKTEETEVRASHLRASQNEIVGARVVQLVNEANAGERDLREKPIFVTRDNYIVDGHHHWAAIVGSGYEKGKDFKVPVHKLDMDIGQALDMANEFTKKAGLAPKSGTTNASTDDVDQFAEVFNFDPDQPRVPAGGPGGGQFGGGGGGHDAHDEHGGGHAHGEHGGIQHEVGEIAEARDLLNAASAGHVAGPIGAGIAHVLEHHVPAVKNAVDKYHAFLVGRYGERGAAYTEAAGLLAAKAGIAALTGGLGGHAAHAGAHAAAHVAEHVAEHAAEAGLGHLTHSLLHGTLDAIPAVRMLGTVAILPIAEGLRASGLGKKLDPLVAKAEKLVGGTIKGAKHVLAETPAKFGLGLGKAVRDIGKRLSKSYQVNADGSMSFVCNEEGDMPSDSEALAAGKALVELACKTLMDALESDPRWMKLVKQDGFAEAVEKMAGGLTANNNPNHDELGRFATHEMTAVEHHEKVLSDVRKEYPGNDEESYQDIASSSYQDHRDAVMKAAGEGTRISDHVLDSDPKLADKILHDFPATHADYLPAHLRGKAPEFKLVGIDMPKYTPKPTMSKVQAKRAAKAEVAKAAARMHQAKPVKYTEEELKKFAEDDAKGSV